MRFSLDVRHGNDKVVHGIKLAISRTTSQFYTFAIENVQLAKSSL